MDRQPGTLQRTLFVGGERLGTALDPKQRGGGDKYEPQTTAQAKTLLAPQMETLVSQVHNLSQELRASNHVYIEAKLLPNYISASDFPSDLLREVGAVPVGSRAAVGPYKTKKEEREAGTRQLILAIPDHGVDTLSRIINRPEGTTGATSASQKRAFDDIKKFNELVISSAVATTSTSSDARDLVTWESVLNPDPDEDGVLVPASEEIRERWIALVQANHGTVIEPYIRIVDAITFVPVRIHPAHIEAIRQFNPLRAIRPMPTIRPIESGVLRSSIGFFGHLIPPQDSKPIRDDLSVAIFDGGVADPKGLFSIETGDLTKRPPDNTKCIPHGTGVTGVALYGIPEAGKPLHTPPLKLSSFRVLPEDGPNPGLGAYWILDRITEKLLREDFNIVNLSLGPDESLEADREPNRWTSELDRLAWQRNILFISAVGNNGHQDDLTGLNRVQPPSDMANGLSVGACTVTHPNARWDRTFYSAIGPGRQGNRIQPNGVQFGGTPDNPFPLISSAGTLDSACGTSFATPLVTHALSHLATRLPNPSPSVLRAFAIHFAERPSTGWVKRQPEVGHGRFLLSFEDALICDANETHTLYTGEIARGDRLGLRLPVPRSFNALLNLRITLAYASPIDPTQPTEYTRASLEMQFRPHHLMFRFSHPDKTGELKKLDYTSEEAQVLVEQGWTQGQEPIAKSLGDSPGKSETDLRESGKWETIRHYHLTLNPGTYREPRLDLSCLARRAGSLDDELSVPYAILVSVRDKEQSGNLYDQTAEQFTELRPVAQLTNQASVQARVR